MNFAFLIYISRSGSTMLARQLAMHSSDMIVLPELNIIEVLISEGQGSIKQMSPKQLFALIKLDHQIQNLGLKDYELMHLAEINCGKGIKPFLENIARFYAPVQGKKAPKYAVFQKGNLAYMHKALLPIFSELKYIHIYRDIRGSINSMIHTDSPYFKNYKMGLGDVYGLSIFYKYYTKKIIELKNSRNVEVFEVKYEELCLNYSIIVKNVIDYIGANYVNGSKIYLYSTGDTEKSIHKLIDKSPVLERIKAWKRELSKWQGVTIEVIAKNELLSLGYERWFLREEGRWSVYIFVIYAYLVHLKCLWIDMFRRFKYYTTRPRLFLVRFKLFLNKAYRR